MPDSFLPLPEALARLASIDEPGNRSLAFDRGFDGFERTGDGCRFVKADPHENQMEGKSWFLERFSTPGRFQPSDDYAPFVARRHEALSRSGARATELRSRSRLVIGLGLPHPTETGLLLDRLTGCPYVPGSSLKGMLRYAAHRLADGELVIDGAAGRELWTQETLERLFGPPGDSELRAKGELIVYDAFPDVWPGLEVDVLTPHYQPYYGDDSAPSTVLPNDWHDPNPVSFLTVAPGTPFTFWLGHRKGAEGEDDLHRVTELLKAALGRLGIGGKTSAGYGVFGDSAPGTPRSLSATITEPIEPPVLPEPPLPQGQALWEDVDLYLDRSRPTVRGPGGAVAQGFPDAVPTALFNRIQQGSMVAVDAVVKKLGTRWTLVRVRSSQSSEG
jgi:CRISPR-associated protein Cmr6